MKKYLLAVILLQLLSACSSRDVTKPGYDYIKILIIGDADSGNAYNKGQGLGGYFYYNSNTDSVILRTGQFLPIDSAGFQTYVGQFDGRHYADTLAMLINFLKRHKNGELSYDYSVPGVDAYDGPKYSVEYGIDGKSHFISFEFLNDTLNQFYEIYARLKASEWDKKLIPNNRINGDEEVVHMLKGLGTYDSLIYTPPYIPLPCEKGINMELLYGRWRTIGSIYGNDKQQYKINTVEKDSSWVLEFLRNGELTPKYSGRILSIDENHIIKVKSKDGIANLKVLNLTKNCFEFIPEGADSNQIWQLYRMK